MDKNASHSGPAYRFLWKNNYVKSFKKYSVFAGRMTRGAFFSFFFTNLTIMFLLGLGGIFTDYVIFLYLYDIYTIIAYPALLSACVRRLHDSNHSGWHLVIPTLITPVIGLSFLIFAQFSPNQMPNMGIAPLLLLAGIFIAAFLYIFILLILKSSPKKNKYDTIKCHPVRTGILLLLFSLFPYITPLFFPELGNEKQTIHLTPNEQEKMNQQLDKIMNPNQTL